MTEWEVQWFRHAAVSAAIEAGWRVPAGKLVVSHHNFHSVLLWRPVPQ
jgi:hypothetical protein